MVFSGPFRCRAVQCFSNKVRKDAGQDVDPLYITGQETEVTLQDEKAVWTWRGDIDWNVIETDTRVEVSVTLYDENKNEIDTFQKVVSVDQDINGAPYRSKETVSYINDIETINSIYDYDIKLTALNGEY